MSSYQVCKNGRCLAEIENIIPDYSHVTETYVEAEDRMDRSDDSATVTSVATLPPSSRRSRIRRPFRRPTRSITIKDPARSFSSEIGKRIYKNNPLKFLVNNLKKTFSFEKFTLKIEGNFN